MEKNVKRVDLFSAYDNMERKRTLEERLKEAVCIGDTDAVQHLLNLGAHVNTVHTDSGWTPLHWACKKGFLDVADTLLKHGANKNIRSILGETPLSLCSNPKIEQLLRASTGPKQILNEPTHNVMAKCLKNVYVHTDVDGSKLRTNSLHQDELVLKIRVAESPDPDFIEIELPPTDLTYQALTQICCQELNLDVNQIVKLRKLPNTKLRTDKDIQRLQNFQEIEVVTNSVNAYKYMQNSNGTPNSIQPMPANGYQSISKKDQTILY